MKARVLVLAAVLALAAGLAPAQDGRLARLGGDDLERHVERTVQASLGTWLDAVAAKVDDRRGQVEVTVELFHPAGLGHLQRQLYALPELAGYIIKVKVEPND